jgi:transposase
LQGCVHLAGRLHRWYSLKKARQHANWQLSYGLRLLVQSEIAELVALAQMLKRWRKEIVNDFVFNASRVSQKGSTPKSSC